MNIFLNAVSSSGKIILFDDNRDIIDEVNINIKGNESEKLIGLLDEFLKKNNLDYSKIENFVVVAGPGSFTGVRIISLMINTINFVTNNYVTKLSYFDLFDKYPIIKSSSRRDSFLKLSKSEDIKIIKNEELLSFLEKNNIGKLYGENKNITDIEILENIDYSNIIKNVNLKKEKQISPIYIKKPSIS